MQKIGGVTAFRIRPQGEAAKSGIDFPETL